MLIRALLIFFSSLALLASEPGLIIRFSQPALESTSKPVGDEVTSPSSSAPSGSSAINSKLHSAHRTLPFAAFHIPANQPPTLGLSAGPFTAEITGFISVDLRAQHTFIVEHTGQATLLINGKEILNTTATAPLETGNAEAFEEVFLSKTKTSAPIRLSKGTNALLIRYTSPKNSSATLRLLWSSKNSAVPLPVPATALSHEPTPSLTESLSIHRGAFLFNLYQCARCHTPDQSVENPFDAPSFAGIGSRLNQDYIAAKILNPSTDRPSRMPKIFHDANSNQNARAIAAFLATLTTNTQPLPSSAPSTTAGAALVSDLNCRSCHTLPAESTSPDRISLTHVSKKFRPAALAAYLQNPQAHYPGNPMPNFKLTRSEAESIASVLIHDSPRPTLEPEAKLANLGKELVQNSGCLNCHSLDLPNKYKVPSTAKLFSKDPSKGCLAPGSPSAPQFSFSDSDRADLAAFLAAFKPGDPIAPDSAEFAVQATEFLRCNQCHIDNTLPQPLTLGGKLKPEWSAQFIAGHISEKPRPWLKARMPAFSAYATNIAAGLAALHGYSAKTPDEPPPAPDLIKTGETLIGSTGGFSCVACHAIGSNNTQLVVESPGINLALSADRLLPDYFHRWLMNPIALNPSTKMPAYFDAEGRSQLTEFFEGDAHKQIDAMWHYIRNLPSATPSQ